MLLGSQQHTIGNTTRWTIDYSRWLDNTAEIQSITAHSSSAALTVTMPTILGHQVQFFISGGNLNETATITLTMVDSFGNTKIDTVLYTVVAA